MLLAWRNCKGGSYNAGDLSLENGDFFYNILDVLSGIEEHSCDRDQGWPMYFWDPKQLLTFTPIHSIDRKVNHISVLGCLKVMGAQKATGALSGGALVL